MPRALFALITLSALTSSPARCDEPDAELRARINQAIERGVANLRDRRQTLGGIGGSEASYPYGIECLTHYTLRVCGVSGDDPFVGYLEAKARTAVQEAPHTYTVSLALLGLLLSDREKNKSRIVEAIARLEAGQLKQEHAGAWGYLLPLGRTTPGGRPPRAAHWEAPPNWWDNSNTQYGVLALRSAVDFGFAVEPQVFVRAAELMVSVQQSDGGFAYDSAGHRPRSYVAMTAGIGGTLVMCQDLLGEGSDARRLRKRIAGSLKRGRQWLGKRLVFPSTDSPWPYYAAYAVERYGHYAHVETFGKTDWALESARWLVDDQAPDGSWSTARLMSGRKGRNPNRTGFVASPSVSDTCFALLVLRRSSSVHTRVSDEVLVLLRGIDSQARPVDLAHIKGRILDAGPRALPQLVKGLFLKAEPARLLAAECLREMSGEDFGFSSASTETEQRRAREAWVRWLLVRTD